LLDLNKDPFAALALDYGVINLNGLRDGSLACLDSFLLPENFDGPVTV
jgi:hypothetical protein